MHPRFRRRNLLPIPSLQLPLVGLCLFLTICSGLVQAILSHRFVADLLIHYPAAAGFHRDQAFLWALRQFASSVAILFPFVFGLGVLVTFRYAGPIVNMKNHLRKIELGEDPGPCRLRKGDRLHDLAEAINRATAALRARAQVPAPPSTAAPTPPRASATEGETESSFETTSR